MFTGHGKPDSNLKSLCILQDTYIWVPRYLSDHSDYATGWMTEKSGSKLRRQKQGSQTDSGGNSATYPRCIEVYFPGDKAAQT
jgi:hypothetical protein